MVLDLIKSELSLKAKKLKLRLSYCGHIMRRQDSLEKRILLRKVEGSTKRGILNTRWANSLKEATDLGLPEQIRAVEDILDIAYS